MEYTEHYKR